MKLTDEQIRASWVSERESMRKFLLEEKKFNPKSVDNVISNFVDSMVFARLPCSSKNGIRAAFRTTR